MRLLAAKIATEIVAPHSPTQIDQLNLVFISVDPGLRGPLCISAIGSRDSHGEASAIGTLDHTVEPNHEEVARSTDSGERSPHNRRSRSSGYSGLRCRSAPAHQDPAARQAQGRGPGYPG
jgi:hypothetical protein